MIEVPTIQKCPLKPAPGQSIVVRELANEESLRALQAAGFQIPEDTQAESLTLNTARVAAVGPPGLDMAGNTVSAPCEAGARVLLYGGSGNTRYTHNGVVYEVLPHSLIVAEITH